MRPYVQIVSCEEKGPIKLTDINKRAFLGGFSVNQEYLFREKMLGSVAIAVYKAHPHYKNQFCENNQVIALGGIDIICIITLNPIGHLHNIKKPKFSRTMNLPYLSWGFGLTPSHREKTVPILAIGWDKVIQLIYINEEGTCLEIDGVFISNDEIIGLHFMADSILFVMFENKIEGRHLKILYCPKFYPGSFKQLEDAESQKLFEYFDKLQSVTAHSILEKKIEDLP